MISRKLINLIPVAKYRKQLLHKYYPETIPGFRVNKNTRMLMVCPHPDDEMLGAGGMMIKNAKHFDCICMASAGVKTPQIDAEPRADLRIKEFNAVMDAVGIKNRWIFKTFGVPPMFDQIEKHFADYCKVLDLKKYDYIFLPNPKDGHPEHLFITNKLFKKIMRHNGYNRDTQIIFYEVWRTISIPDFFYDISDVAQKKFEIIGLYKSQNGWINYPFRIEGLNRYRGMQNNNTDYAEAFQITSVKKYLRGVKKC